MNNFFAGLDYAGEPFRLFGPAHLAALGVVLLVSVFLIYFRFHSDEKLRRYFRYGLAILLLVNEALYHLWRGVTGQWTIQIMLPLHLCAIAVYLSAIMLITKNYTLYKYLYFFGIGAALQALLTPNASIWGFPHFRFFQTFIAHGSIVTAALYMTIVERYRPYWKSILPIIIGMNIYMVFVQIVNFSIGSNYLWIGRKPEFSSLIDLLGPWPWYIIPMEIIGIISCLVLYLPFALSDWRKKHAVAG
jgi:hypothetical integral membrane protein (TIGR02206 family)